MIGCRYCEETGFLNSDQYAGIEDLSIESGLAWIKQHPETDMAICNCCGNGEDWYGEPGYHAGDVAGKYVFYPY